MPDFYCTVYSHFTDFEAIIEEIRLLYPKAVFEFEQEDESKIVHFTLKGGLFQSDKKLKISYRTRLNPSYQLVKNECPLTHNLFGMRGFVSSLPSKNIEVKNLLLHKIETLNCEVSLSLEKNTEKDFLIILKQLAIKFDAIIFAQPDKIMSQSTSQHFLDKNLRLILDVMGNNQVDKIDVIIESKYYDQPESEITEAQIQRKLKSEKLLEQYQIPINYHLPCIESEEETEIRTAKEITERIVALAITNGVAFNNILGNEALDYIADYQLIKLITPKENEFLNNPTEQSKINETWKVEGIWTLMWALNIVDDLEFPDHLADLNKVPFELYPIGEGNDPNKFMERNTFVRSKAEIVDMADLYYRFDWACVEARVKGKEMQIIHPSVVYERHYALNWLINYMDQDWDAVSTDT